jgi:uncharacterized protein
MQDWEEQRELFPTRRRPVNPPPPRPRIRPNVFAKWARFCAGNPVIILIAAVFVLAAALSFAALNAKFSFDSPIAISIDSQTQNANDQLDREFPQISSLIVVRASGETADMAKAAIKSVAAALDQDKTNVKNTFIPGIGPYYDRFGIYYLGLAEIETRVQYAMQLKPLFQALALSPNLTGLSALVTQVATAVQNGRSPRGLENLFQQISETISAQAVGKPTPMDWQTVAGLRVDSVNKDWVAIVEPQPGRLKPARETVQALLVSALQSQPALKITADYPPSSSPDIEGSMVRQVVVCCALALLFFGLVLIFSLQYLRSVILVLTPIFAAAVVGLVVASLMRPGIDRVAMAFVPAVLMAVAALACCVCEILAKPRLQAASTVSFIMLAAQDMGPLAFAIGAIAIAMWASWFYVPVSSISDLALIATSAMLAGMATTFLLVPSLAKLLPQTDHVSAQEFVSREFLVQWRRLRPTLSILVISACLFCIVFFSSLHFSGSSQGDVTRGIQFMVEDEQAATKLSSDLKAIPEVGTVRWIGTFLPDGTQEKQRVIQGLSGALTWSDAAAALGPQNPVSKLQEIEVGLRTIADEAGTDETLRASAHELRRTLAVLTNTSTSLEATAVELESLVFSGFAALPKDADRLAALSPPQVADFDPRLRRIFVSDSGKWRLEALPKHLIAAGAFIAAMQGSGAVPRGPLVKAQAELTALQAMAGWPLAFGLVISFVLAFVYLRKFLDWLIVVIATLMPMSLFAAIAVTTDTSIEPQAIPALIIAVNASLIMALISVARKQHPQMSLLAVFLPVALVLAIVLPLQLLQISELLAFSRALIIFLICVTLFNIIVVQQLCAWSLGTARSGPRLPPRRPVTEPEEDLGDDAL